MSEDPNKETPQQEIERIRESAGRTIGELRTLLTELAGHRPWAIEKAFRAGVIAGYRTPLINKHQTFDQFSNYVWAQYVQSMSSTEKAAMMRPDLYPGPQATDECAACGHARNLHGEICSGVLVGPQPCRCTGFAAEQIQQSCMICGYQKPFKVHHQPSGCGVCYECHDAAVAGRKSQQQEKAVGRVHAMMRRKQFDEIYVALKHINALIDNLDHEPCSNPQDTEKGARS
jgi:hypothetical protein